MASARRRRRTKIAQAVNRRKLYAHERLSVSKRNCMNKVRYESERIALAKMQYLNAKIADSNLQRAYRCNHCKGWHLTSKNQ